MPVKSPRNSNIRSPYISTTSQSALVWNRSVRDLTRRGYSLTNSAIEREVKGMHKVTLSFGPVSSQRGLPMESLGRKTPLLAIPKSGSLVRLMMKSRVHSNFIAVFETESSKLYPICCSSFFAPGK